MDIRYTLDGLTYSQKCQLEYALNERINALETFLADTEHEEAAFLRSARDAWRRDAAQCYHLRGRLMSLAPHKAAEVHGGYCGRTWPGPCLRTGTGTHGQHREHTCNMPARERPHVHWCWCGAFKPADGADDDRE